MTSTIVKIIFGYIASSAALSKNGNDNNNTLDSKMKALSLEFLTIWAPTISKLVASSR